MGTKARLGVLVNPIAGMGGKVGLKGTDGTEVLRRALQLGSARVSPQKAVEALKRLIPFQDCFELITCRFEMGEEEARQCSLDFRLVGSATKHTSCEDTKNGAREMLSLGVDLILFAGGDGTARDLFEVVGQNVPLLGIPAGVKMHSAVFALTPKKAGDLTMAFLDRRAVLRESEIMDVDEVAFRTGTVAGRLFGYVQVPYERAMMQSAKSSFYTPCDKESQRAIAEYVVEQLQNDCHYVLGPGSTVSAIARVLEIKKTLLGVDLVYKKKLLAADVNEQSLLELTDGKATKIIVSPIGGQGFIFGRGNQQIGPKVITNVGRENIIVVATPGKLLSLGYSQPLLVDTGDPAVDDYLSGYVRVITGYRQETVIQVSA